MKKFKLLTVAALIAVGSLVCVSCGKNKVEEVKEPEVEEVESPEDICVAPEGMIKSDLTGEWIDESFANQRPAGFMINNIGEAMPQSGISQADIVYEMQVEGGITRLFAIFQDYSNLEKVGPIRSARHYYVREALEYDAIYCHVGQSVVAEQEIKDTDVLDINGMYNNMIVRDESRKAPHNAYTNTDKLKEAIDQAGYSYEHNDSYEKKFEFYSKDTDIDGQSALNIHTTYNSSRKPYFEYDESTKEYLRFQFGDKQIDDQTNEQLSYKNVIVQFCTHSPLLDELIDIQLDGEGEGYYFTNGKAIPITWKKDGTYGTTHYYTEDGEQLMMNPGKTWITISPSSQKDDVTFE